MIIVQLTGGLGNQLFQYAMGRAFSEISKEELLLDINSYLWDTLRKYELESFNLDVRKATKIEIDTIKRSILTWKDRIFYKLKGESIPYYRFPYIKEQSFNFDPNFIHYRQKNCYLEGYWQSEKYFKQIRSILLQEICVEEKFYSNKMNDYVTQIKNTNNSVSIHVRRGDYVSNPETTAFHGVCDLLYYLRAMNQIENLISNPNYFIFSDDTNYALELFKDKENVTFVENLPFDYEELLLMSFCNHNIIANSSFSWWGAWLNQNDKKHVIAPKRWFANEIMQNQTDDLIPFEWIKI
jgi:hypothetical protein